MAKLPSFLRHENDCVYFNGEGELVFYIPEHFFDLDRAIIDGDLVETIGIFDYAVFDKNGVAIKFATRGKMKELHSFRVPSFFITKPYTIERVKDLTLTRHVKSQDYRLLKYKKGDKIIVSTKIAQDAVNTESFFMMFLNGNLPNTIPYDEIYKYVVESGKLNGINYGLTIQLLGIIISELCRDPKDPKVPFRLTDMEDMTAYEFINITKVPKYVSPYTAITSENWGEAVTHAVLNTKQNHIIDSPMEKIMIP